MTEVVRVTAEEGALPSTPFVPLVYLCEKCGHDHHLHYREQTYYAENQKFITMCCIRPDCTCVVTTAEAYVDGR